MKKYKELSRLSKIDIKNRIEEIRIDLIKAKITAGKGGKVKIRELKKTLARLLMLSKS